MTQILAIQRALAAAGFSPGLLDDAWGPVTAKAFKRWQLANGIVDTGVPDAVSISTLLSQQAAAPILWVEEAKRLFGLKEGKGAKDNPVILDWAKDLDAYYPHDDVAWCGLFVAHTLRVALPNEPLPANILGARQYEKLGVRVLPQLGAIGMFWRESKNSGKGHVGYLVGETADAYTVLGGNQGDAVSFANVGKDRFLQCRWPATAGEAPQIKLPAKPAGKLSLNEA